MSGSGRASATEWLLGDEEGAAHWRVSNEDGTRARRGRSRGLGELSRNLDSYQYVVGCGAYESPLGRTNVPVAEFSEPRDIMAAIAAMSC
jgi:hypothetical protein